MNAFSISFSSDVVWTEYGLSKVEYFKEGGRNVPILFVKTPSGVVAAGLRPASIRWHNKTVFASFVAIDGREFEVNTRFYGERRELLGFCAELLRQRRMAFEAKRVKTLKADKAKKEQLQRKAAA